MLVSKIVLVIPDDRVSGASGANCVVEDGTLASPTLDETWDVGSISVAPPFGKLTEVAV